MPKETVSLKSLRLAEIAADLSLAHIGTDNIEDTMGSGTDDGSSKAPMSEDRIRPPQRMGLRSAVSPSSPPFLGGRVKHRRGS